MNVLHICANPRPIEESASKQLAAAFFARLVEKNPDVMVNNVDLYEEPPPFLSYAAYRRLYNPVTDPTYKPSKDEEKSITYASAQAEMLRAADVLVMTMPMWCGGPPAILKAWIDQVLEPGMMYEMGAEGIRRNDRKSAEPVTKEDARARIANLRAMLGNKPGTIG